MRLKCRSLFYAILVVTCVAILAPIHVDFSWSSERFVEPSPFDLSPLVGSETLFHPKNQGNWIFRAFVDPRLDVITALTLLGHGTPHVVVGICHGSTKPQITVRVKCVLREKYSLRCPCDVRLTKFITILLPKSKGLLAAKQTLPVEKVPKFLSDERKGSLALCLAPIFGRGLLWLLLLQTIEWHRTVGVQRFFIYFLNSPDKATKTLLEYYVRQENIAELIHIPTNTPCSTTHACRHDFELQDCMFRTMNRFAHVAAVDIDEILVPLKHDSLVDLIRLVDKPSCGSFSFQNRWILRTEPEPNGSVLVNGTVGNLHLTIERRISLLKYTNGTSLAPVGHTCKAIFKPDTPRYMGVHHVHGWHYPWLHKECLVPPNMGYVRHFRDKLTWGLHFYRDALRFGPHQITQVPLQLLNRTLKAVYCSAGKIKRVFTRFCL